MSKRRALHGCFRRVLRPVHDPALDRVHAVRGALRREQRRVRVVHRDVDAEVVAARREDRRSRRAARAGRAAAGSASRGSRRRTGRRSPWEARRAPSSRASRAAAGRSARAGRCAPSARAASERCAGDACGCGGGGTPSTASRGTTGSDAINSSRASSGSRAPARQQALGGAIVLRDGEREGHVGGGLDRQLRRSRATAAGDREGDRDDDEREGSDRDQQSHPRHRGIEIRDRTPRRSARRSDGGPHGRT